MTDLQHRISIKRFLAIGPYEEEPDFKTMLTELSQRGMFIAGLLGAIVVIIYVGAYISIGKTIVWSYSGIDPGTEFVLFDKCVVIVLCLGSIFCSRLSFSLFNARLLIFFLVWVASLAMLLDDIAHRDLSVGPAYISLALILAVGTIPYKGWHTAVISFIVIVTSILAVHWVPIFLGWNAIELLSEQMIYLSLVAILLTGMSSQLYLNRYDQFRARHRAQQLSKQLEERADTLEKMKQKSDRQAQKILEHEKLKDRFFTNISHEFRTPLTLILGPLKDVIGDHKDQQKRKVSISTLRLMYNNGQQLLEMINQLLDLSKVDAGRIRLNRHQVELGKLIEETVHSFFPMAESRQVKLQCKIAKNTIPAFVDPEQLRRVVSNLVSNAIKFTPTGGEVSVSVSTVEGQDGVVEIKVRDTGKGIPRKELPFIFDRFYQVANSTETGKGTGIGLALVKEIVELHGGEIKVESEAGIGSEFVILLDHGVANQSGDLGDYTMELPMDDDWEEVKWGEDIEEDQATSENATIVVVDDNPDILTYLNSFLSRRYEVLLFEKSSEAIEAIRNQKVDLVVSDVMMADPDGFEFCRIIKGDPDLNHIPVILLTARAGEESRLEGLELGADDYISKPFSASELLIRVENLIELRRLLREKFSEEIRVKGKKVDVSSEDARFLKQVQSAIEKHMEDGNFSVDWLADEVNLSSRQLQRKLRAITHLSAGGYIRLLRLERASQLLAQHWGNVSEVSYKVGFNDSKYFSRLFKQTFGETPSEFANKK